MLLHQTIIEYKNMIIEYDVSIKAIFEQGKNFSWTKPKACPCCDDNVLWGTDLLCVTLAKLIQESILSAISAAVVKA